MGVATGMGKEAAKMEFYDKTMKKKRSILIRIIVNYLKLPKVAGNLFFLDILHIDQYISGSLHIYHGFKYPLPEKRSKGLYQEYAKIE